MVIYGPSDGGYLCLFAEGADNKESMAGRFCAGFVYLVGNPSSMSQKVITALITAIRR
jgi:hypothetical protein